MQHFPLQGRRIPQPDTPSCAMMPDLKRITLGCLEYNPDKRPAADQLWRLLGQPDMYGLQGKIPVSRSTTVECQALEVHILVQLVIRFTKLKRVLNGTK